MVDITAFQHGWWKQFLRSMGEGEEFTSDIDPGRLKALRVSITNTRKELLFFETEYKDGTVWIKRLTREEWTKSPKRRKI